MKSRIPTRDSRQTSANGQKQDGSVNKQQTGVLQYWRPEKKTAKIEAVIMSMEPQTIGPLLLPAARAMFQ